MRTRGTDSEAVKAGAENRAGDLYRWCGSVISGGRAKSIAMPVKDRRGELHLHPNDIMTEWTRYYKELGDDTTGHSRVCDTGRLSSTPRLIGRN